MSILDGIEDAPIQHNSDFIRGGRYVCRVEAMSIGKNRKQEESFRILFTILHVVDISDSADDPKGPHRVGDTVIWSIMKRYEGALKTIKTAIVALTGCEPEEVTKPMVETITSASQPLKGTFCDLESRLITKKDGGRFTRVTIKREMSLDEVLAQVPKHIAEKFGLSK